MAIDMDLVEETMGENIFRQLSFVEPGFFDNPYVVVKMVLSSESEQPRRALIRKTEAQVFDSTYRVILETDYIWKAKMTAVDTAGNESEFSNTAVCDLIKPKAISGVRFE